MKKIMLIALVLIGGTIVAAIAADSKSPSGKEGRYQVVNTTISVPGPVKYDLSQPVMIDTVTGNTWVLTQPEGSPVAWYPLTKSDTFPQPKSQAPAANNSPVSEQPKQ